MVRANGKKSGVMCGVFRRTLVGRWVSFGVRGVGGVACACVGVPSTEAVRLVGGVAVAASVAKEGRASDTGLGSARARLAVSVLLALAGVASVIPAVFVAAVVGRHGGILRPCDGLGVPYGSGVGVGCVGAASTALGVLSAPLPSRVAAVAAARVAHAVLVSGVGAVAIVVAR